MKLLGSLLLLISLASCGGGGGSSGASGGGGGNSGSAADSWLVDTSFVRDGGPGKDGIPSIDNPIYVPADEVDYLSDNELVVGIRVNGVTRAFPHSILNWHEIVNVETEGDFHAMIYCPLTGTAALWTVPDSFTNKMFGVSGKLYNSNIIPYDRGTDSNWVQMLGQSVNGSLKGDFIEENAVIETTWATWKQMYPETTALSEVTGFSRDYTNYPYGSYLTNSNLLFGVANEDARLHKKKRVLGVNENGVNKVYEVDSFTSAVEVINEASSTSPYIVVGSSSLNFAIAYSSKTADGTDLTFTAVQSSLPVVMVDNEGNEWDALGMAVSGDRIGEKLTLKSDFIGFWFAWVAIHPSPTIHNFL